MFSVALSLNPTPRRLGVEPAGRYPAPSFRGARTFLAPRLRGGRPWLVAVLFNREPGDAVLSSDNIHRQRDLAGDGPARHERRGETPLRDGSRDRSHQSGVKTGRGRGDCPREA